MGLRPQQLATHAFKLGGICRSSSSNRIITVRATNSSDVRWASSNFSSTVVDLFALGVSIYLYAYENTDFSDII